VASARSLDSPFRRFSIGAGADDRHSSMLAGSPNWGRGAGKGDTECGFSRRPRWSRPAPAEYRDRSGVENVSLAPPAGAPGRGERLPPQRARSGGSSAAFGSARRRAGDGLVSNRGMPVPAGGGWGIVIASGRPDTRGQAGDLPWALADQQGGRRFPKTLSGPKRGRRQADNPPRIGGRIEKRRKESRRPRRGGLCG